MDTNIMRPSKQEANVMGSGWKSAEFRKLMVKKVLEASLKQPHFRAQKFSELVKSIEIFEEKMNASAKDEAEYIANISAKIKAINALSRPTGSNLLLSNSCGSGARRAAYIEWQEQVFQKVQRIKGTYFTKLNIVYQQMMSKLQQHSSAPQEQMTADLDKLRYRKKILEHIFVLLRVTKSQITTDFKEKLDKAEKYIHSILHPQNVSLHHQGQHSTEVHSMQQIVPSYSRISQVEIFERKPMSTQNSHLTKQISQRNKMRLQKQQVAKQYRNSQPEANRLSAVEGPGNGVEQQTHGALKSAKEFGISIPGIIASPMIEGCNNLNEISQKSTVISDDPTPAMWRLVEGLTSISPEALSASIGDIGEVVYLNDLIPMSEMLHGPPKSIIGTDLAAEIDTCSQERYLTCDNLVPTGRKMSRCIKTMHSDSRMCFSTSASFNQLSNAEKPDSNTVTSQVKRPRTVENCSILEEIKEINKLLIDTEVVVGEDSIPSAARGAAEHGEGLIVKFLFSAVSVNQNLVSQYASDKKTIIKPLLLLVPTSYPFFSPVIFDEIPFEVSLDSENLEDLSMKAKSKLKISLRCLKQPWSLREIAMSWEHCAREAILEYAQHNGGGTFSSKYGAWEICSYSH